MLETSCIIFYVVSIFDFKTNFNLYKLIHTKISYTFGKLKYSILGNINLNGFPNTLIWNIFTILLKL